MFEKFTEKAIKVIMLAQEEARRMGHNHVATEQILLGLIGEGTGIAAKTLKSMKVTLKEAREQVQKIVGIGPGQVDVEIPFTPGAKRVLECAWDEARQLGVNYIGTEHLLLGIVRVEEDHARTVLERLGVPLDAVKPAVIGVMDKGTGIARERPKLETPRIDQFSDDVLRTFIVAREETRRLGHKSVSTELLLLGLIGEENGPAAENLRSAGVTPDNARWETERVIGRGTGQIPVDSPFSDLTNDVLKVASALAVKLAHDSTTGAHLLLALIEIKCAGTETILKNLNVDLSKLRSSTISTLGGMTAGMTGMFGQIRESNVESTLAMIIPQLQDRLASITPGVVTAKVITGSTENRFERFTESAIKVVMLAPEESRRLGHNFVGTEQILLGMIGERKSIAALALESQGATLEDARREVEKIIGRGPGFVAVEVPFTPRANRVFDLAWEEAQSWGHNFVGSEHLLLALLREGEGVATRVLEILDVDSEKLRAKVIELMKGRGTATA
jgi:ATP-dependent Clp protease ATP-binding subunit ClpA